ncbi:hypothetical protein E4U12_002310 [Claviceps purpurea]|nr:hypothetical protein E4U12_002310 [Claviceps purpurea]
MSHVRLERKRFNDFIRLVHSQHPLPSILVAELFLRPQPDNDVSPDPRIPPYIQALSQHGYVEAPSILRALYKYSSLHAQLNPVAQLGAMDAIDDEKGREDGASGKKPMRRWRSSSWLEEVMFYHVIKTMVEETAFRDRELRCNCATLCPNGWGYSPRCQHSLGVHSRLETSSCCQHAEERDLVYADA